MIRKYLQQLRARQAARIKRERERSEWVRQAADLIRSQMETIDHQDAELAELRDPERVMALVRRIAQQELTRRGPYIN